MITYDAILKSDKVKCNILQVRHALERMVVGRILKVERKATRVSMFGVAEVRCGRCASVQTSGVLCLLCMATAGSPSFW